MSFGFLEVGILVGIQLRYLFRRFKNYLTARDFVLYDDV